MGDSSGHFGCTSLLLFAPFLVLASHPLQAGTRVQHQHVHEPVAAPSDNAEHPIGTRCDDAGAKAPWHGRTVANLSADEEEARLQWCMLYVCRLWTM